MKNIRPTFILALILIIFFSLNFNNPARCDDIFIKNQSGWKKGRITRVDYAKREISFQDLKGLKITDNTLNRVNNKKTWKNIKEIHEGSELLLRYNNSNKVINEYWILHDLEKAYDLANFVYIQEKKMNKIVQSYHIGDVDIVNIHAGNRVHLIINDQYLNLLSNIESKKLTINTKVQPKGGQPEILHLPERNFTGSEMLSANHIIYDIEDLGFGEGYKVKIMITLRHKDQYQDKNINEWKIISSKELVLNIKKFGLRSYSFDTVSFVRDSFGRNWKPAPGASVTIGFTFFTLGRTNRWSLAKLAKIWNAIDPRIGINITLLDFDEDKNMEYGLGPVISILKGGIYIGTGWNLSTKRNKNRYVFFGISITQIAKKIMGESKIEK